VRSWRLALAPPFCVEDGVPDVPDGLVQFVDGVPDLAGSAVLADQSLLTRKWTSGPELAPPQVSALPDVSASDRASLLITPGGCLDPSGPAEGRSLGWLPRRQPGP
jgi:hypothetical protein